MPDICQACEFICSSQGKRPHPACRKPVRKSPCTPQALLKVLAVATQEGSPCQDACHCICSKQPRFAKVQAGCI